MCIRLLGSGPSHAGPSHESSTVTLLIIARQCNEMRDLDCDAWIEELLTGQRAQTAAGSAGLGLRVKRAASSLSLQRPQQETVEARQQVQGTQSRTLS